MSSPIRTSPEGDHRRLPRTKRVPSSRDQAIFVRYRATGRSQQELATDFRLSQRRISAILQRVERWFSAGLGSHSIDCQRLDRWLQREQSQAIYDRALRAFDQGPKELKTVRKGERDGKPFEEETCRELPPSAQLLRAAIAAKRDLSRLANQPPVPMSAEENLAQRRANAHQYLTEVRDRADRAGKVAPDLCPSKLMSDLIKTVCGEPNDGIALAVLGRDRAHQRQKAAEWDAAERARVKAQEQASNRSNKGSSRNSKTKAPEALPPIAANSDGATEIRDEIRASGEIRTNGSDRPVSRPK